MTMSPLCELAPDSDGGVVIVVRGRVDLAGAQSIIDLAASVSGARRVVIDIDQVNWLSEDAAALLVFRRPEGKGNREVALVASEERARQMVLEAYALRRARNATAP